MLEITPNNSDQYKTMAMTSTLWRGVALGAACWYLNETWGTTILYLSHDNLDQE